jgi:hypothetical protein
MKGSKAKRKNIKPLNDVNTGKSDTTFLTQGFSCLCAFFLAPLGQ